MLPGAIYTAEDSCFVINQFENDGAPPTVESLDVEKTGITSLKSSTTGQPEVETEKLSQLDRKPSRADRVPGSDPSDLTSDDEKDDFPEGGLRAWSVVAGAFCGSFAIFGLINSTGVLLDYFSNHQLKDYNSSQIGWIFGLALFLTFFCGAPVGPIFDAYGPRALIFAGSVLLVLSMFLLGLCTRKYSSHLAQHPTNIETEYWHFFLVYSVLNGLGGCLINTPCVASIGHFFLVRRGNATGIAMTSGSIGGIVFPLMLQRLIPMVGLRGPPGSWALFLSSCSS